MDPRLRTPPPRPHLHCTEATQLLRHLRWNISDPLWTWRLSHLTPRAGRLPMLTYNWIMIASLRQPIIGHLRQPGVPYLHFFFRLRLLRKSMTKLPRKVRILCHCLETCVVFAVKSSTGIVMHHPSYAVLYKHNESLFTPLWTRVFAWSYGVHRDTFTHISCSPVSDYTNQAKVLHMISSL